MDVPRKLDWDGKHLPEELKRLPPGRYVLTRGGYLGRPLREGGERPSGGTGRGLTRTCQDAPEVQSSIERTLSK